MIQFLDIAKTHEFTRLIGNASHREMCKTGGEIDFPYDWNNDSPEERYTRANDLAKKWIEDNPDHFPVGSYRVVGSHYSKKNRDSNYKTGKLCIPCYIYSWGYSSHSKTMYMLYLSMTGERDYAEVQFHELASMGFEKIEESLFTELCKMHSVTPEDHFMFIERNLSRSSEISINRNEKYFTALEKSFTQLKEEVLGNSMSESEFRSFLEKEIKRLEMKGYTPFNLVRKSKLKAEDLKMYTRMDVCMMMLKDAFSVNAYELFQDSWYNLLRK